MMVGLNSRQTKGGRLFARNAVVFVLAASILAPNYLYAQAADLDTSFGVGGKVTTGFGDLSEAGALAIQGLPLFPAISSSRLPATTRTARWTQASGLEAESPQISSAQPGRLPWQSRETTRLWLRVSAAVGSRWPVTTGTVRWTQRSAPGAKSLQILGAAMPWRRPWQYSQTARLWLRGTPSPSFRLG